MSIPMRTDWIQTYTGYRFWPLEPRAEDVRIEDIAHALSLVCRFGGHCRVHYSVAQHSVLASHNCAYPMHALLHDAEEAYLADICRPVKRSLVAVGVTAIADAADRIMSSVSEHFGLKWNYLIHAAVNMIDNRLLATEQRDLILPMADGSSWTAADTFPRLEQVIVPVDPPTAERMFLDRYEELKNAGF